MFSNVYPQAYHSLFTLPQGHIICGLSGYGYTISTYSTISTFNSSNPANISVLFWESVDRKYSNKLNNSELSGTVGYQFNTKFSLSFGVFSNYYRYDKNNSSIDYNKLHANYFFCGFTFTINSFFSELVIADSHLLSDDWRKQTIVKLGLGYEF